VERGVAEPRGDLPVGVLAERLEEQDLGDVVLRLDLHRVHLPPVLLAHASGLGVAREA